MISVVISVISVVISVIPVISVNRLTLTSPGHIGSEDAP